MTVATLTKIFSQKLETQTFKVPYSLHRGCFQKNLKNLDANFFVLLFYVISHAEENISFGNSRVEATTAPECTVVYIQAILLFKFYVVSSKLKVLCFIKRILVVYTFSIVKMV